MLDRYWFGNTTRISPEAPVPVVHVQHCENRPGGAANVAVNIASIGAQPILMGIIGKDQEGKELLDLLENKAVTCCFYFSGNHPTITKLRVLGQNQQLIRMDFEKNLDATVSAQMLEAFNQKLDEVNMVVLSDYAKGALLTFAPELIKLARNKNIPVLVDPKSNNFNCYRGATLITPNLKEFEAVVGPSTSEEQLISKARDLIKEYDFKGLLITQGKEGMTLVVEHEEAVHIPAHAHEVYDVTGAGDTVIAIIASALAGGESLSQSVRWGNLAAGIVVTKLGAETVSIAELRRAAQRRGQLAEGIVGEEELVTLVNDARGRGESIVMTNGCFDILHTGHIEYLYQAKNLGKRLIVAVNDDASVSRLKGKERPLNSLQDRMIVLSALRIVDWVVPFSEDTPERLISVISPDFLVKGGDYKVNQIAGADHVLAYGGQVKILNFKPGYSTTSLMNKISAVQLNEA